MTSEIDKLKHFHVENYSDTNKITASDYTHLFGYLNPYYRSAYHVPKRRK